jgi:hypothetical protein
MSGWIKSHRKIQDHWLWQSSEVNYFQAWQDMLFSAAYKPHNVMIKKQLVNVDVGQLAWSEAFMQKRWNWSRNKVRNFLNNLLNDHMIHLDRNHPKVHLTTIITICNYRKYQDNETEQGTAKGTAEGTAKGTAEGTQLKKVKKEKKGKNEKKLNIPPNISLENWPDLPSPQTFNDWMEVRKNKKATNTQTAFTRIGNQLSKAVKEKFTVEECIATAVQRDWKGFEFSWIQSEGKQKKATQSPQKEFREFGS